MKEELVVVFSRKGYAARVANEIAQRDNADILRLRTTERTEGILGFWWCGRFGMHRWPMPLAPYDVDVSAYKRVVLVSPIWVFDLCAPMRAFAQQCSGRVADAHYVFVHFSPLIGLGRTARWLDSTLGVTADGYESVGCIWGGLYGRKTFGALTKS